MLTHEQYTASQQELQRAHALYHQGEPTDIGDFDYSTRLAELKLFELKHPELADPDSVTKKIGLERAPENGIEHASPMLSLDNCFTIQELERWRERTQGAIYPMWKIDGMALSLVYEDGVLVYAASRGNRLVGESYTHLAPFIAGVPLRLSKAPLGRVEIRGEALITTAQFNRLNIEQLKRGKPAYKSSRNLTAGSFLLQDTLEFARRKLQFIAYDLISTELKLKLFRERIELLAQWGFMDARLVGMTAKDVEAQIAVAYADTLRKRGAIGYDTDGLVFMVDSLSDHERLGSNAQYPLYATAFKFTPLEVMTVVEQIDVQISRTGAVTPMARITPVTIAGATITNITLHNASRLKEMDVRVGDSVMVRRDGEVVPGIASVLYELRMADSQPFEMPTHCPSCASELMDVQGSPRQHCLNLNCVERLVQRIVYSLGPAGLDVDGFGPALVRSLYEHASLRAPSWPGFVTCLLANPSVLQTHGQLSADYGAKLLKNIQERLEKVRPVELLVSLGIDGVGKMTALKIINSGVDLLVDGEDGVDEDGRVQLIRDLSERRVIDSTATMGLLAWNRSYASSDIALLKPLDIKKRAVVITQEQAQEQDLPYLGAFTFCLSGSFRLGKRKLEELLTQAGASVYPNVNTDVTHLVSSDASTAKHKRALALDIAILTEDELLAMLGAR